MTAGVQPGWPELQVTHPHPLRATARPARGRPASVATLLSVVESPFQVVAGASYLVDLMERMTGPTRCGPVVVRFTTEDDQALALLDSSMVAGVVPAPEIEAALDDYIAVGPHGVLLVACCLRLWPQTLDTRRWS